jgi:hypothetical protein
MKAETYYWILAVYLAYTLYKKQTPSGMAAQVAQEVTGSEPGMCSDPYTGEYYPC